MPKDNGTPKRTKRPRASARQQEFLAAFRSLRRKMGGQSPSLDELSEVLNVNRSTVQGLVNRLVRDGYLMRVTGGHRSLRLTAAGARTAAKAARKGGAQ